MPDAVSRTKTNTSPRAPGRHSEDSPYLSVRYWKRMRIHKVYPVIVSGSGQGETEPVTVRMVVAGAQVVPAEQTIDPSNAADKVTFYVTPLARGGLRGERLEVVQDGRKVQELRIPSKVTSQKGTLVWLILALFIPWLLLHFFEYSPIGYQLPLNDNGTVKYVQKPWEKYMAMCKDRKGELLPDRPSRVITDFIKDNTFDIQEMLSLDKNSDLVEYYNDARTFPERAYLHVFERYHSLSLPLPFILFLVLMLLTFISFLARTESRRTVYGKPLP